MQLHVTVHSIKRVWLKTTLALLSICILLGILLLKGRLRDNLTLIQQLVKKEYAVQTHKSEILSVCYVISMKFLFS